MAPSSHRRTSSRRTSFPLPLLGRVPLPRKAILLPGLLALSLGLVLLASLQTTRLQPWSSFSSSSGGEEMRVWSEGKGREERAQCDSVWRQKLKELEEAELEMQQEVSAVEQVAEKSTWSVEGEVAKGRTRFDVLEEMVARTKGFYVRDWPLHLGWNNIRYIVEASLLHAELLNRTLVVPSHVYARSCDFSPETCEAFAIMVHRGITFDSNEWDYLPREKQWCWRIPIHLMLDTSSIQLTRPLVTMTEFLALIGLPPSHEPARGFFTPLHLFLPKGITYSDIANEAYDKDVTRVDRMPASFASLDLVEVRSKGLGKQAWELMDKGEKLVENWDDLKRNLGWQGGDMELEKKLEEVGVYPLWTWRGVLGMEVIHTTDSPLKQVALGERIAGMWDDFNGRDEKVLHLWGETHQYRKPGALRFTTPLARSAYAKMMVYDISTPAKILRMATTLAGRMTERAGGRMWVAAHMRRGDFVKFGWAMNGDPEAHFLRITSTLEKGRALLSEIKESGTFQSYPNPGATISPEIKEQEVPRDSDPFYIATDERNATFISSMRDRGALFVDDLLTFEDRRDFAAWELVFTDVMGLLEQSLLSHASYVYGHALSSVAAGVVNQRARLGKDPRTALLD